MGQDQSRDSTPVHINTGLPSQPPAFFNPQEMNAFVVLRKRGDGSSVKELYIPQWKVAFYKSGGSIDIITDCSHSGGKAIKISAENSLILYNAWVIYVDSQRVLQSTLPFVSLYLDSSSKL